MPDPITAVVAGGATLLGSSMQSSAAKSASGAQQASAEAGIAEQRRQFDKIRELLQPYVDVGAPALVQQRALIGLGGIPAQQAAIAGIEASPLYQASVRQGEEAMLQRAAATGGLRGGNIQAALAQFRPQMLQSEIERQYSRLGGLTSLGQQSAVGVGTSGQAMGTNIAKLLEQQGAAQAGGIIGSAAPYAQMANIPMQLAGMNYAKTGQFGFGNIFGGSSGGGFVPSYGPSASNIVNNGLYSGSAYLGMPGW